VYRVSAQHSEFRSNHAVGPGASLSIPFLILGKERPDALSSSSPRESSSSQELVRHARAEAQAGRDRQAEAGYREALQASPLDADLWIECGEFLEQRQRLPEARACYQRALDTPSPPALAWLRFGTVSNGLHEEAAALPALLQALELRPRDANVHHQLGWAFFALGYTDEAVMHYFQALGLGAGRTVEDLLANTVAFSPSADPAFVLATRREWSRRHHPPAPQAKRFARTRPLNRPLRIGYVCALFAHENWMKPVWALIQRQDRTQFEVHLFSTGKSPNPPANYKPHPQDHWHPIHKLSPAERAALIERCEIDLLIELSGFTDFQGLETYAYRPAPVQLAWFNDYATFGLEGIDYFIGDAVVIRPEEESFYVEQIERVPGSYLTFACDYPTPEIGPLPCERAGVFTFGSACTMYKYTPAVISLWASILRQTPRSRLLLKNAAFVAECNRSFFRERFADLGVAEDRLILEGPADHAEFLRVYQQIDLALDTFPYNGGTTTSEALWQGVPVLTLSGDRWVARTSASLLHAAGLHEFVVENETDYAHKAIELGTSVSSRPALAALRSNLRARLQTSPVCDCTTFAREMEALYLRVWNKWQSRQELEDQAGSRNESNSPRG